MNTLNEKCGYCNKEFKNKKILLQHQKTVKSCIKLQEKEKHQHDETTHIKCPNCNKILTIRSYKKHKINCDIKNDLKSDIRRLETVVESVERDSKVAQRDTDKSVQDARKDVRETKQEVDKITRQLEKDTTQQNKELQRQVDGAVRQLQKENEQEIKQLRRELDDKIKKALDNPLANK